MKDKKSQSSDHANTGIGGKCPKSNVLRKSPHGTTTGVGARPDSTRNDKR